MQAAVSELESQVCALPCLVSIASGKVCRRMFRRVAVSWGGCVFVLHKIIKPSTTLEAECASEGRRGWEEIANVWFFFFFSA